MLDAVFFVSSAIRTDGRMSIFTNEVRFQQTLRTIESIQQYVPNSSIYLIESSAEPVDPMWLDQIASKGVKIFNAASHPLVQRLSAQSAKNVVELASMIVFMDFFMKNPERAKRYYKISGRYWLNEHFRLGTEEHKDAFVFMNRVNSWMSDEHQEATGMFQFYETRLYHFDASLLERYQPLLKDMFDIAMHYSVNCEHATFNVLTEHKIKVIELERIGANGYISPTGEYKDD